jgi:Zn-dependent protease
MLIDLLLALAAVVGLLALIRGSQLVTAYALFLRLRFKPAGFLRVERDAAPDDARLLLDGVTAPLAALGFHYLGSARLGQPQVVGDPEPIWGDFYRHAGGRSFAFAQPAELPEPGGLVAVAFVSLLADGRNLTTVNRRGHLFLQVPEELLVEDALAAGLAGQWQQHERRLAELGVEVLADEAILWQRQADIHCGLLDHWRRCGLMVPAGADLWRLTPGAAWRHLRHMLVGGRRLAKLPRLLGEEPLEARVIADTKALRTNEALHRAGIFSRAAKIALFAASAVAGALAFGLTLSWELAPIILGVLLFHEFGHAIAMRATGYRNLGVLVIPLLGAVAVGRNDEATPWQKLVVLLAGPLPGLLVAIVCLRYGLARPDSPDWLELLGAVALGLNLFNLLPVMPLDGGQILEIFLFSRFPRLRIAFVLGSWPVLAALGYWLESPILIGLAVVMALGGMALWRGMTLAARVGTVPGPEAPRAAFTVLHSMPNLAQRPFAHRLAAVKGILPMVVGRRPRAWESLAGLLIYAAVVALPVVSLWETAPIAQIAKSLFPDLTREAPDRDWDAELARATTAEARWQLLYEAGESFEEREDEAEALRRFRAAGVIADEFPARDVRRLDSRIALIRLDPPPGGPIAAYEELMPELRQLQGDDRRRLAEVLEILFWLERDGPAAARQQRLREAIAVREGLSGDSPWPLFSDRRELAWLLDKDGDPAAAESLLRARLPWDDAGLREAVGQTPQLAWFLIAQGRGAEAETLLLEQTPDAAASRAEILVWARLSQGKNLAVRDDLSAALARLPKTADWRRLLLLLDLIKIGRASCRERVS